MAQLLEEAGFVYEGTLNVNPSLCIDWFDELGTNNPFSYLSNFYPAPLEVFGQTWATAEHAYAAQKVFPSDPIYKQILYSTDPQEAKTLGRDAVNIRREWDAIKYNVMKEVVWAKFSQNSSLAHGLLSTGNAYLQEGTFWYDDIWGVNLLGTNPDGSTYIIKNPLDRTGRNWLGTILMETRSRLKLAIDSFGSF